MDTEKDTEISTSELNVLTLTPFFPSAQDEIRGCYIAESLEALREQNVNSHVIAVSPLHYPPPSASAAAPAEWVRFPQLPGNFGLSSAGKFLHARLLGKVRQMHHQHPIDLIHAHAALPCGHAAMLLSRSLNIPFVVTLHGLDVFNTCFLGGVPARWRRAVSMDVYRAARTVICISRKVQDVLLAGMPNTVRTAVVYNGTNSQLFAPAASSDSSATQEILIVGNLLRGKGHELVLQAMKKIQSAFPRLRCKIIGEGPDRSRFLALAKELGIDSQVEFTGQMSRVAVADAMRACTLLALPSRYEGLGCVYLEAMACAKPVIACRGQGIDEIIEHGKNGWLISVDGLDELVQGLRDLLASSELPSRIGAAARETVLTRLTMAHQAGQLAEIYRKAIA
jgi:teichuronic acid biosynthesis glycosyltransferase TuaC